MKNTLTPAQMLAEAPTTFRPVPRYYLASNVFRALVFEGKVEYYNVLGEWKVATHPQEPTQ